MKLILLKTVKTVQRLLMLQYICMTNHAENGIKEILTYNPIQCVFSLPSRFIVMLIDNILNERMVLTIY